MPHPPCAPLQLGLQGGLTHLLWALAFLRRCCAHLAKSCCHPPSASAHPPSPRLSPVPAAKASLAGFTRSTLSPAQGLEFKDSSSLSSSFPPSLHSRLHPPLWLSPVSLQTCVLSTPSPSSLVRRFGCGHCPRCSSLVFSHMCAPFRPLPSPLHLVKIISALHVARSHGQSSLMALSAASGP